MKPFRPIECAGRGLRILLASSWLLTVPALAETLVGRVVGVSDGDTVTVLDASLTQHRVRIAGIDAPERRQPFSNRAKLNLSATVMGRQVTVDWRKKDRYKRLVGVVHVAGVDAGLEQISAGFAWHYKAYEREQPPDERRRYSNAESEARLERKGLWSLSAPQPPWEFRQERRVR